MAVSTAVTPVVRTVTQQVVVTYKYNARTHVTTVTRSRPRRVKARFVGTKIYLLNAAGHWARIPYIWSSRKAALVYNRRLHLTLIAAAKPKPKPTPPAPGADPSPGYVSKDPARHLLRRATYGPTPTLLEDVARLGIAGWVDRQLTPASIDDSACEAVLARLPDQAEPIWQVHDLLDRGERNGWDQLRGVMTAHVARAAWSERQLLSVMEDFWGNHFNVTTPGAEVPSSRAHYAHTIRTHAFGRFADLLRAVTLHPAMLTYLNNRTSSDVHPNENHGRELLELHTVGVDAGYGEQGVLNSARILTGLSVSWDSGEYLYAPWRHSVGSVSVMGFSHANTTKAGGEAVALAYINHLAHRPETAHRIALKLARHFVSDTPPTSLVEALASTYLAHDTAIAPVLRQLFTSSEFSASIGMKTRRPYEELIATVRTLGLGAELGTGVESIEALIWMAGDAGQPPLGWPFPTGHPDVAAAWLSTASTLARWNNTMNLVANWWPTTFTRPDLRAHLTYGVTPATCGAAVDMVCLRLFGRTLTPAHRAAVLTFLDEDADAPITENTGVLTWYLEQLVALLLNSPYHLTR